MQEHTSQLSTHPSIHLFIFQELYFCAFPQGANSSGAPRTKGKFEMQNSCKKLPLSAKPVARPHALHCFFLSFLYLSFPPSYDLEFRSKWLSDTRIKTFIGVGTQSQFSDWQFDSEDCVCQLSYIVEVFHKLKVQLHDFDKNVFNVHIQYLLHKLLYSLQPLILWNIYIPIFKMCEVAYNYFIQKHMNQDIWGPVS